MSTINYLYLIKTVDDNKVLLVTTIKTFEGATRYEGMPCTVLNSYTPPIDLAEVLSDIQNSSTEPQQIITHHGRKPTGKIYTDHLGNAFESIGQMCAYHNISVPNYRSRLAKGWTQEEALTRPHATQVLDHCGNVFKSKTDMCKHYGVSLSLFDARIKAGKSLEEALLGTDNTRESIVVDHLGNQYKNLSEMCKAYGVSMQVYALRKKRGWILEELLKGKTKYISDHKGNTYSSVEEMCLKYGVKTPTYRYRIKTGWTIEEALTGLKKDSAVSDHLNNHYPSVKAMCESYDLNISAYNYRISHGYTLQEALTGVRNPSPHTSPKTSSPIKKCRTYKRKAISPCTDHLGNQYNSQAEMAIAYGLNPALYFSRKQNGWDIEQILTAPTHKRRKGTTFDFKGVTYESNKVFCEKHGLNYQVFSRRINSGMTIEDAFKAGRADKLRSVNKAVDHNGKKYANIDEMCEAYGVNIQTYKYRREHGWDVEQALTTPTNRKK